MDTLEEASTEGVVWVQGTYVDTVVTEYHVSPEYLCHCKPESSNIIVIVVPS